MNEILHVSDPKLRDMSSKCSLIKAVLSRNA